MTTTQPDFTSFDNDPEAEQVNRDMHEAGEKIETKQIINYFGTPEAVRYYLPDGEQWFEFTPLTEGGKAKYEKATNKDIRVQRTTGDAKMQVDPATERQTLVKLSTTACHILAPSKATGSLQPIAFSPKEPGDFWDKVFGAFPPKIIQDYYREIRKNNDWMSADEDIEALELEYENMGQRIEKLKEDAEKKSSS